MMSKTNGDMNTSKCPICNSGLTDKVYKTSLCSVTVCGLCGHQYTITSSIKAKEVYDREYFEKMHKNWFANPHIHLFEKIEHNIKKHICTQGSLDRNETRIIDLGCGTGSFLRYMHSQGYRSLKGVDICEPPSSLPREIDFIKSSIENYDDNGFDYDIVVSTLAIEHVEQPILMLRKIRQLLSKNGVAVIVTNDVETPLYNLAKLMRRVGASQSFDRLYHPHHLNHLTKRHLSNAASIAGLEVVSTEGIDIPLRSLDIPGSNRLSVYMNKIVVRLLFGLGRISQHRFLQVQVLRIA